MLTSLHFNLRDKVAEICEDCRKLEKNDRKIQVLDYNVTDQAKRKEMKKSVTEFLENPEVS
jgi:hypothetical protein